MKTVFASGFVVLYLVALCRPVAPLIEFYTRRNYFAQVLCINKDKPEMHCNGSCALAKKLKEANQTENSNLPIKIDFTVYPIGFVTEFVLPLNEREDITLKKQPFYTALSYSCYLQKLFRPPR